MKRVLGMMLALTALLLSLSAVAGSLSFRLSLTGSQLTVVNQGDSSAFYPAVFRMLPDGGWGRLEAASAVADLAAGARVQFTWPDMRPPEQASELERMQPVMVRFFDQAGVGFGQISFFHAPPAARTALKARYVSGALQIEPPDSVPSIRASWVLWPQEEGIRPIRLPVRFEHHPPPALRIDWRRQGKAPFRLDTGAGQPAVILIHDTEQGFAQQLVPDGGLQGREQRAAWLDATPMFYAASMIALAIAAGAMVLQFLRRPRYRAKS
jgi:hypothetical protein